MKKKEAFFIVNGTLCIKDHGSYLRVLRVNCFNEQGDRLPLIPSYEDEHVVLWEESLRGKPGKISTIKKIPASKEFDGLRVPGKYAHHYLLDAEPYVLATEDQKPRARSKTKEHA